MENQQLRKLCHHNPKILSPPPRSFSSLAPPSSSVVLAQFFSPLVERRVRSPSVSTYYLNVFVLPYRKSLVSAAGFTALGSAATPSLQSLITQAAPPSELGRIMAGILIIENLHTIPFWIWFKYGVADHVSVLYFYCFMVSSLPSNAKVVLRSGCCIDRYCSCCLRASCSHYVRQTLFRLRSFEVTWGTEKVKVQLIKKHLRYSARLLGTGYVLQWRLSMLSIVVFSPSVLYIKVVRIGFLFGL